MIVQVLSVRDRAAETFGRPIFAAAIGVAVRELTDEVNKVAADSLLARHPGDFELLHLGTFDDREGHFELFRIPVLICSCSSLAVQGGSAGGAAIDDPIIASRMRPIA